MATKLFNKATIRLEFMNGVNDKGQEVYRAKNFADAHEQATAQQVEQFATAFASLTTTPLAQVEFSTQYIIH